MQIFGGNLNPNKLAELRMHAKEILLLPLKVENPQQQQQQQQQQQHQQKTLRNLNLILRKCKNIEEFPKDWSIVSV